MYRVSIEDRQGQSSVPLEIIELSLFKKASVQFEGKQPQMLLVYLLYTYSTQYKNTG